MTFDGGGSTKIRKIEENKTTDLGLATGPTWHGPCLGMGMQWANQARHNLAMEGEAGRPKQGLHAPREAQSNPAACLSEHEPNTYRAGLACQNIF